MMCDFLYMVLSDSRYSTVAPLGAVVGVSLSPFGIWVIVKLLGFSCWFGCGFAEICRNLRVCTIFEFERERLTVQHSAVSSSPFWR